MFGSGSYIMFSFVLHKNTCRSVEASSRLNASEGSFKVPNITDVRNIKEWNNFV